MSDDSDWIHIVMTTTTHTLYVAVCTVPICGVIQYSTTEKGFEEEKIKEGNDPSMKKIMEGNPWTHAMEFKTSFRILGPT